VLRYRPVILNRAPSLHKHSVQAFKPVLFEGKSIRLNPLIVHGFNADFDGDTMNLMVPISPEAVEEAKHMMPEAILFKHGDNQLVPMLSQDYLYGLNRLSLITKKSIKKFATIQEAKASGIGWTVRFKLSGKNMTLGQYMINEPLPPALKDYKRVMNNVTVRSTLTLIGKQYPSYFTDVINT